MRTTVIDVGASGWRKGLSPSDSKVLDPLRWLHSGQAVRTFCHEVTPISSPDGMATRSPDFRAIDLGTTWSMVSRRRSGVPSGRRSTSPQ